MTGDADRNFEAMSGNSQLPYLAAKLRLAHENFRQRRLREVENRVLIAAQDSAIDALRFQTFMEMDFTEKRIARTDTMTDAEVRRLEKLIRDMSSRAPL
ncbi:uncharacterized protein LOC129589159 [Paramacrobiotus metropolitanus]|uniref:uncharacterized protein LOC129589159 n=1 Tax=Paramacrobiotus metropolitanus TaxID=2943436 RepID=UPI0024456356|nr:uncharacterized protein LOC129589159 [Paramacrobiotus metropolitanus]XP_055339698.1 uncharacterized protein LOC129589159 [Paramacrobiotus metropolitanus]XP_055339699.1 uncharacterized protein LOC129589159 [Paramacrobiotus metropolitanus]